jgi:hypothetical protein
MKIVITEQQLKRIISEQPESRFIPRGMSAKDNMNTLSGSSRELGPNLDVDDYTDIISGLIDVIPGIGNLVSAGIDITHGITYIVRFSFAKTTEEKAEMAVMGLITLGMTTIPIGGNAANIAARSGVKTLLKMTPHEVLVVAKNMGLIKSAGFKLSKQVWKYSLLIALVKIFRGKLGDAVGDVTKKLTYIANNSNELKPYLNDFTKEMKDVMDIMDVNDTPINKSFPKPNMT